MSFPSSPLRRYIFVAIVVLVSGSMWLAFWQVAQKLLGFTVVSRSITLVYIPAGIRLVILLVSGFWGALGIALAFPFALFQVFPEATWAEALAYSTIAGFVPYGAVVGVCRAARISNDLGTLRSIHLPLLAAAVSIAGALSYTCALVAFGRFQSAHFVADFTAMTAGDFLGCFAVVMLVRFAIVARRKFR